MNTDDLTPMEAVVVEYFPTRPDDGELAEADAANKRVPGSCVSQVVAAFTLLVCGSASLFFLASFSEEAFLASRKSAAGGLAALEGAPSSPSSSSAGVKREYSYSSLPLKAGGGSADVVGSTEEEREQALEESFLKYAEMKASLGPVAAASSSTSTRQRPLPEPQSESSGPAARVVDAGIDGTEAADGGNGESYESADNSDLNRGTSEDNGGYLRGAEHYTARQGEEAHSEAEGITVLTSDVTSNEDVGSVADGSIGADKDIKGVGSSMGMAREWMRDNNYALGNAEDAGVDDDVDDDDGANFVLSGRFADYAVGESAESPPAAVDAVDAVQVSPPAIETTKDASSATAGSTDASTVAVVVDVSRNATRRRTTASTPAIDVSIDTADDGDDDGNAVADVSGHDEFFEDGFFPPSEFDDGDEFGARADEHVREYAPRAEYLRRPIPGDVAGSVGITAAAGNGGTRGRGDAAVETSPTTTTPRAEIEGNRSRRLEGEVPTELNGTTAEDGHVTVAGPRADVVIRPSSSSSSPSSTASGDVLTTSRSTAITSSSTAADSPTTPLIPASAGSEIANKNREDGTAIDGGTTSTQPEAESSSSTTTASISGPLITVIPARRQPHEAAELVAEVNGRPVERENSDNGEPSPTASKSEDGSWIESLTGGAGVIVGSGTSSDKRRVEAKENDTSAADDMNASVDPDKVEVPSEDLTSSTRKPEWKLEAEKFAEKIRKRKQRRENSTAEKNVSNKRKAVTTNLIPDATDPEDVLGAHGAKMRSYMNESVDPCDDFYEFACGGWDDLHPIPSDWSGITTYSLLRAEIEKAVRQLLEEPDDVLTSLYNGTAALKAKRYYQSCMDIEGIEARGVQPLIDVLDELGGWPILGRGNWSDLGFDWVATVTKLRVLNNNVLVEAWLSIDPGNSSQHVLQLDQAALYLGSRDYYTKTRFEPLREKYFELIVDVAVLLGADRAAAEVDARNIIDFETQIAQARTPRESRQSIVDLYRKISLEDLQNYTEHAVNWTTYLTGITFGKYDEADPIVVYDPGYLAKLTEIVGLTDPRTVANYLLWMFTSNRIQNAGRDFEEAQERYLRFATGRSKSPPRWEFCTQYVKGNWAHVVGALFIRRFYDEESLLTTNNMIDSLMEEFLRLLKNSTWMDDVTREKAIAKAVNMRRNIGYPDYMDDPALVDEIYANVTITDNFLENQMQMVRNHVRLEMAGWGAAVNRSLWSTPPTTVNAFYHFEKNQIMFPAGILQPPFFHKSFPMSLSFGGIGTVIGHEITHGFDDKGRSFDESGNLNQWWDKLTEETFQQRAKCVSDMFSEFHLPEVSLHLNGITTRGENIADLGGIKVAHTAYRRWLKGNSGADNSVPGMNFTHEQLFFINYAQVWCSNPRPESLINQIKQGRHTPGKYRILGTLASTPAFAEAFQCASNSPMTPATRCEVW